MAPDHRLARRALGVGIAAVVLGIVGLTGCEPAKPAITVTTPAALTATQEGTVTFSFRCTATEPCTGETRLRLAGVNGPVKAFTIAAGATQAQTVKLNAAQQAAVPAESTGSGEIRITESAPSAIAGRGVAVTVTRPAAPPTETPTSRAYRERNWTPTATDTCSAAFHRTFSVIGPDGKLYPTWHPPTAVDPATGTTCSFGHEHGDDPARSDLYRWVTDFLGASPSESRGIPFGFVSEALDTYASTRDRVTRHEDNVGHKIIVVNDLTLVTASPRGYLRDRTGAVITCDVLMKVHQGSHSADALINNAHELLHAVRCSDGTELISSTLTRFGDANQFNRSCTSELVTTAGSNLPDGDGGLRLIPDRFCVDRDVLVPSDRTSSIWSLYEIWRSANDLTRADGSSLASFDPAFGVRNPARAHAGGVNSSTFDLVDVPGATDTADGGTTRGYPFDEVTEHEHETGTQLAKGDPASPFDGAQRDFTLHTIRVTNASGATTWWTDPYGEGAVTAAAPGLVRQHVSSTDNSAWPELEKRTFDLQRDHGRANGVHAPN
ncbi:MAG: hypothetical protein JWO77_2773 [Ilumatobacteraceae bacterium]|nr:hypothetical protein [Ilumatobacteraceae bacterium]